MAAQSVPMVTSAVLGAQFQSSVSQAAQLGRKSRSASGVLRESFNLQRGNLPASYVHPVQHVQELVVPPHNAAPRAPLHKRTGVQRVIVAVSVCTKMRQPQQRVASATLVIGAHPLRVSHAARTLSIQTHLPTSSPTARAAQNAQQQVAASA